MRILVTALVPVFVVVGIGLLLAVVIRHRRMVPSKGLVALVVVGLLGIGVFAGAYKKLLRTMEVVRSDDLEPKGVPATGLVSLGVPMPPEARPEDHAYVLMASSQGSTIDLEVLNEKKRLLLKRVASDPIATALVKDMSLLWNLADHPEQSDYNFRVIEVLDDFHVNGNKYDEVLQFHLKADQPDWRRDPRLRVFRCKFGLGTRARSESEAYDLFTVETRRSSGEASHRLEKGFWTLTAFGTRSRMADNFTMAIPLPVTALDAEGRGIVTIRVAEVAQDTPYSQYWFETHRFRRGVDRILATLHFATKPRSTPSASSLSITQGTKLPVIGVLMRESAVGTDAWKFTVDLPSRSDPLVVVFEQG